MEKLVLEDGWVVAQDVHETGEKLGVFNPDWNANDVSHAFSEWQPVNRLSHLQIIFAKNPYFGRELRYFNEHPWWYKKEFKISAKDNSFASLRFWGIDYFCKVWLNGEYLGEHEGYFAPFEFDVTKVLKHGENNVLVVKVWSPWDSETIPGFELFRTYAVIRDMVKGTYEHADTFIQRDVNPVGIWGEVSIYFYENIRFLEKPYVTTSLSDENTDADVSVMCVLGNNTDHDIDSTVTCRIVDEETGVVVTESDEKFTLKSGATEVPLRLTVNNPKLWWTWDRGEAPLYRAVISIEVAGKEVAGITERFGIRTIEIRRTKDETTVVLNDKDLYIRGTTYFPEVYVSNMYRERYYGDLLALRRAGCNAIRVHVHVEKPELYELCDRMGIVVIQDSDLNWIHTQDEAWKDRAIAVFGDMIRELRNHPSIIAWVCYNEPLNTTGDPLHFSQSPLYNLCPAPQLLDEARRLDPLRPAIKGSGAWDDLESGDSHNWTGSIDGEDTHYLEIFDKPEKLNSEFGFDAPPDPLNLQKFPELQKRLNATRKDVHMLQHYQYRLIKYFIERYRITKYKPCSGYFHFMFRDLCPQSFYGVYDWWGVPKEGLKAFEESNQPVGIFLEHTDMPIAVWAINDFDRDFGACCVEWIATNADREVLFEGGKEIKLAQDSVVKVTDLDVSVNAEREVLIVLKMRMMDGTLLAENRYEDPFHHPVHPKGHHSRVSHEHGMRVYHL